MKASQLINELSKAEKLDTYQEELNLFAGYDLLVVDDFGLMNMDVNKCRNLFEVFDSRDPHKSILVISQFPVSSWYDMFQDHTYAEACLARMLSGAYRLEMNGKNMRNMEPINKQQQMDNAPLVRASYTADAGKGLRLSEMCNSGSLSSHEKN